MEGRRELFYWIAGRKGLGLNETEKLLNGRSVNTAWGPEYKEGVSPGIGPDATFVTLLRSLLRCSKFDSRVKMAQLCDDMVSDSECGQWRQTGHCRRRRN